MCERLECSHLPFPVLSLFPSHPPLVSLWRVTDHEGDPEQKGRVSNAGKNPCGAGHDLGIREARAGGEQVSNSGVEGPTESSLEWGPNGDKTTVLGPGFRRASENDSKTQKCSKEMLEGSSLRHPLGLTCGISPPPIVCLKLTLGSCLPYLSLWWPPGYYYYSLFGPEWQRPWLYLPPLPSLRKTEVTFCKLPEPQQGVSSGAWFLPLGVSRSDSWTTHMFWLLFSTYSLWEHTDRNWIKGPLLLNVNSHMYLESFGLKVQQPPLHLLAEYQLSLLHSHCMGVNCSFNYKANNIWGALTGTFT